MPTTVIPYTAENGQARCVVRTTLEDGTPQLELDCPIGDCPHPCAAGAVPAACQTLSGQPCPLGVVPPVVDP